MRGMAYVALPFRNGFMLREGRFLPLDRIGVARSAYGDHGPLQQGRLRGRMGGMAREATVLADQRPVQLVLPEGFVDHF